MWNYLFYIAYIQIKDRNEFNGTESYVFEQIERDEIKWFPVDKALCIVENEENQQEIQV